jgi:hypothetical protein
MLAPFLGLLTLRQGLQLVRWTALVCAMIALYVAHRAGRMLEVPPGKPADRTVNLPLE